MRRRQAKKIARDLAFLNYRLDTVWCAERKLAKRLVTIIRRRNAPCKNLMQYQREAIEWLLSRKDVVGLG